MLEACRVVSVTLGPLHIPRETYSKVVGEHESAPPVYLCTTFAGRHACLSRVSPTVQFLHQKGQSHAFRSRTRATYVRCLFHFSLFSSLFCPSSFGGTYMPWMCSRSYLVASGRGIVCHSSLVSSPWVLVLLRWALLFCMCLFSSIESFFLVACFVATG